MTEMICCACGACVSKCPTKCVTMRPDAGGFLYPQIDIETCINCGACRDTCPMFESTKPRSPLAYAAYHKDDDVRRGSSSGGIFHALANNVLRDNGVVFGVGFDENWDVCHQYVERFEDLQRLMTSKYTQSRIGDAFKQAELFLKNGRRVYFSGTPCQIAGLKNYLGRDYYGLVTQDIICHGVPSPKVWQKYLVEKFPGKTLRSVNFRDKTRGWNTFCMKITYDGGEYNQLATKDPFMRAFLANLCLRPSCHNCKYKTLGRMSDITLADFWGVGHLLPDWGDNRGISIVMTHSQVGQDSLDNCDEIESVKIDAQRAVLYNYAALHSVAPHPKRRYFFDHLDCMPLEKLVNRCSYVSIYMRIYRLLHRVLNKAKRAVISREKGR